MKAIDISKLDDKHSYDFDIDEVALYAVDIMDGEYCGWNGSEPIKAVDVVPRSCIDKLLRVFDSIAAMDGTCSAHYVVRTIHNFCDQE